MTPTGRCGQEHPEHEGLVCDSMGRHGDHTAVHRDLGLVIWPNEPVLVQEQARSSRVGARPTRFALANQIAGAVRPEQHAQARPSPPPFDKDAWVRTTTRTLHEFLLTRAEPFTTAEHLWPLIDAPAEKRAMVIPVRRALANVWMREVDARRLDGLYTTRDGESFPMNKIVPVYQSLVVRHAG